MKKFTFIFLSLFTLLLVSCGSNSKSENLNSYNNITPEMIDANLNDNAHRLNNYNKLNVIESNNESEYDVNIVNYTNGLIIYSSSSEIKFYSLIKGEYIGEDYYSVETTRYKVFENYCLGFYLYLYDTLAEKYYYYDSIGNLLATEYDVYDPNSCRINTYIHYSKFTTNGFRMDIACYKDGERIEKTYTYDNNNNLKAIDIVEDNTSYSGPIKGDNYVDISKIDSKTFLGKEGYYFVVNENNYLVYDNTGKLISNYVCPELRDGIIVDDFVYYQTKDRLPDDEDEYDYYLNVYKYSLESYRLNLITGKREEVKLDYIINSFVSQYYDKSNNPSYCIAKVNRIGKNKTIWADYEEQEEVLIGKDGKIVTSTLGLFLKSYIKLNNGNYYNFDSGIIYDSKLKPITCISKVETIYVRGLGFICTLDGKYGLIDEDGKVALEFIYNSIEEYAYANNVIIVSDKYAYKYNVTSKTKEQICNADNFVSFGNSIYGVKNADDECTLYSLKEKIGILSYETNQFAKIKTIFGDFDVLINYNDYNYHIYTVQAE